MATTIGSLEQWSSGIYGRFTHCGEPLLLVDDTRNMGKILYCKCGAESRFTPSEDWSGWPKPEGVVNQAEPEIDAMQHFINQL